MKSFHGKRGKNKVWDCEKTLSVFCLSHLCVKKYKMSAWDSERLRERERERWERERVCVCVFRRVKERER